jgi:hypothetical protein
LPDEPRRVPSQGMRLALVVRLHKWPFALLTLVVLRTTSDATVYGARCRVPRERLRAHRAVRADRRIGSAGRSNDLLSKGGSYVFSAAARRHRSAVPWRTLAEVELATLEWVDWYNNTRLHSACRGAPPAEFEQARSNNNIQDQLPL